MNKHRGTISLDWQVCVDGAPVTGAAGAASVGVAFVRLAASGCAGAVVAATMRWFGCDELSGRVPELAPGRYRVGVALFDGQGRVLDHHPAQVVDVAAGEDTYLGGFAFDVVNPEAVRAARTRTLRGHRRSA